MLLFLNGVCKASRKKISQLCESEIHQRLKIITSERNSTLWIMKDMKDVATVSALTKITYL